MTPGFLGSFSGSLKPFFIGGDPIREILVKIPPEVRRADGPRDSPMAKPMKQGPVRFGGRNIKMLIMKNNSTVMSSMPTLIPERMGMANGAQGSPLRAANADRLLACVLMRMPKKATP